MITNLSKRPTILVFVAYYLPGYKSGGPVRAIENLVNHLGDEFHFRIVCRDRDALDEAPYRGIEADSWNTIGNSEVYYISPDSLGLGAIESLIRTTRHDILYLNSLFDPNFSILPLLARRLSGSGGRATILAPRGELAAGALKLKSIKKSMFLFAAKRAGLFRRIIWQASNAFETTDIRRAMGASAGRIAEAIELPPAVDPIVCTRSADATGSRHLKLLYLSRISRDKNLHFALDVLQRVKGAVEFSIAGPLREPEYWERCRKAIERLPGNIRVEYVGAIEHSEVLSVFAGHDLFFLPTVGENYGYVIPESLSVGTPVLISDRSGWRNLEGTGAGWDLPLEEPGRFVEVIESCAAMSPEQRDAQRKATAAYYSSAQQATEAVSASRNLFLGAIEEPELGVLA